MRSLFSMSLQHPHRTYMGQWEALISAAINAGVQVYKIKTEEEMAEEALEFKEAQAAAAAAREAEALRIQQEAIKSMQPKAQPSAAAGAPSDTILGMKPTTFYVTAGLAAGVLVLGTMLLTKK